MYVLCGANAPVVKYSHHMGDPSSVPGGNIFSSCFTKGWRELWSSLLIVYRDEMKRGAAKVAMGDGCEATCFAY